MATVSRLCVMMLYLLENEKRRRKWNLLLLIFVMHSVMVDTARRNLVRVLGCKAEEQLEELT